jgi:hypothetical protein
VITGARFGCGGVGFTGFVGAGDVTGFDFLSSEQPGKNKEAAIPAVTIPFLSPYRIFSRFFCILFMEGFNY